MDPFNQSHQQHPPGPLNTLPPHGVPARIDTIHQPPDASYRTRSRYGFEMDDDTESSTGLLEYWHILRRHKKAILFSALGGIVLGVAVGVPMKPVFRARASVEVLNMNENFMNMKDANPVSNTDESYETSEEQTQAKLLEGEALQKRVMARLDPGRPPVAAKPKPATSGWRKWLHLNQPVPMTERQKLLAGLTTSLRIRPTVRTRILEITADSTDAKLASEYVNTLVQEFIQQNVDARLNTTQRTSEWLDREINDAKAKLQHDEDALQNYASQSGLIFTNQNANSNNDDKSTVATEKLQQLQTQLSTATNDRIAKQSHYELAKNSPPDALGDVLNDDSVRDTSIKMNDLRSQIASMGAIFSPGYSKLQQAQAQLTALENTFQRQRSDILRHIENDYTEASAREKMLTAAYDEQSRDVTGEGGKLVQYNILKREADSSRQLYDTMLQQTKQASIATAMRASNVRLVDPADVPDLSVFPNFKLNAAIGLFAGLFFSIILVTMHDRADRTLQQPGDIALWTDLPELGTIPAASALASSAGGGRRALRVRNETNGMELMTSRQKSSIVAEAFRCTLTSVLFMGENGSRSRVLVFTSASPGDGKTSIVSNLAIATAEIRRKILVIDADLRRPRMHDIFNLPNDRGLSDILREEISHDNLAGLIQQTDVPGLHVLPAGPPTQAAAHLLYSPNLGALITRFRAEYDMILIDAPPMLQMTDARVAGRLADAVILVARAGKTTRDALLAARERFREDRIVVLGSILNDWNPKKAAGGYYGYGGSYNAAKDYLSAK
jgi:polysaccharide biosynthesis transport protein